MSANKSKLCMGQVPTRVHDGSKAMFPCENRTRHESGLCPAHRSTWKPKRARGPEFFTFHHNGSERVETHIKNAANGVTLRMDDAEVTLRWSRTLGMFEVRSMRKTGTRDSMSLHPSSTNVLHIKVGD